MHPLVLGWSKLKQVLANEVPARSAAPKPPCSAGLCLQGRRQLGHAGAAFPVLNRLPR